jgi:hypothetical protein
MMGLTQGSYEAYCFDQAVWYVGTFITSELEKAGHKPQKGEAQVKAARTKVLNKYLESADAPGQYADPALLFADM